MTGTDTGVAAIAAEIIGAPLDSVRVLWPATRTKRRWPASAAGAWSPTRLGNAVALAARDARDQILDYASKSSR